MVSSPWSSLIILLISCLTISTFFKVRTQKFIRFLIWLVPRRKSRYPRQSVRPSLVVKCFRVIELRFWKNTSCHILGHKKILWPHLSWKSRGHILGHKKYCGHILAENQENQHFRFLLSEIWSLKSCWARNTCCTKKLKDSFNTVTLHIFWSYQSALFKTKSAWLINVLLFFQNFLKTIEIDEILRKYYTPNSKWLVLWKTPVVYRVS